MGIRVTVMALRHGQVSITITDKFDCYDLKQGAVNQQTAQVITLGSPVAAGSVVVVGAE